jgi:hypothetical protein
MFEYVYFSRQLRELQGAIKLYRVAVAGGAPVDLDLEIGEELRFRPDGRRFAFTRLEGGGPKLRGEIWVMENVLVGIGLPQVAGVLAKYTHAPNLKMVLEIGVMEPRPIHPTVQIVPSPTGNNASSTHDKRRKWTKTSRAIAPRAYHADSM